MSRALVSRVRSRLSISPGLGGAGCTLAAGLALVGAALGVTGCAEPRRPDIVVITVDTLRADHVGAYAAGASTPRLDELAAQATVFERCTAPMPLTRPSHFSLLTSLYPREHGVMNNAMRLPDTARSLTEILAENGYRTGGFVGVKLLGPDSGADQGFAYYEQPGAARERDAESVVRSALAWVAGLEGDAPYFLWVHVFDPHLPYTPPEPFRGDIPPDRPVLTWKRLAEIAEQHAGDVPAAYLAEGKALYRGEVAYVDHWIGELLAGLGQPERTLVVFTADHGECFENGVYFEHADCLWEGGVHIPLIVRYPPMFGAGERVAGQTSIVDVAPTVLRAAGIEPPAGLSGLALQERQALDGRHVLIQHPYYQPEAAARRPQRVAALRSVAGEPVAEILVDRERVGLAGVEWKFLRTGEREELYRLAPQADERLNVVDAAPEVAARLRPVLERQLADHPWNAIDAPEINADLLETLKALGYVGGAESRRPRTVFVVSAALVALLLPVLSFDFGITEDEQLHNNHGHDILDYFLGQSDDATRHPIAASGALEFVYDDEANDLSGALNIYGGVFDLLCAATYRWVSPFGEFENRHFVNSLFGVLLIVFTGLVAREVAGWRAGVLALALVACSPRIIGHSMNNPVDLPFAGLYVFSLYFLLRFLDELPRPAARTWLPLVVGIPLAADVRIAGLVLIFYLLLFGGAWSVLRVARAGRRPAARALALTALSGAACYVLVSAPWPLAHGNPLTTPLLALQHLSRLETFNALDLFAGRWIDRPDLPWHFALTWLVIGTPLFVPLGVLLTPLLFGARRSTVPPAPEIDLPRVGVIAWACVFPLLFLILRGSYIYNDARHVMFVYPPLIVLCAVGFECALRLRSRAVHAALVLVLAGTLLEPLLFMVRNHPHQNVYFSPLIGGVDGAWARYETDYWGNSVREAVEWIQEHTDPGQAGPVRVRSWYGDQKKVSYWVEKRSGYEHVIVDARSPDWDFQVQQTVAAKYSPAQLSAWPLPGTVYEVQADDTPLTAVVMNFRGREPDAVLERMRAWADEVLTHAAYWTLADAYRHYGRQAEWVEALRRSAALEPEPVARTHDAYIEMGLALHGAGLHEESLLAYRLAVLRDPTSSVAYNNICSAHNLLRQWSEARRACEKALDLEPDFALAQENLRVAKGGLAAE